MTLPSLLKRVEKAMGPDRDLDRDLWRALGGTIEKRGKHERWKLDGVLQDELWTWLTASIDAAVALCERVLPDMNCYGVEKEPGIWSAYVSRNNVDSGHWYKAGEHKVNGALALLAALLRAHLEPKDKDDARSS